MDWFKKFQQERAYDKAIAARKKIGKNTDKYIKNLNKSLKAKLGAIPLPKEPKILNFNENYQGQTQIAKGRYIAKIKEVKREYADRNINSLDDNQFTELKIKIAEPASWLLGREPEGTYLREMWEDGKGNSAPREFITRGTRANVIKLFEMYGNNNASGGKRRKSTRRASRRVRRYTRKNK